MNILFLTIPITFGLLVFFIVGFFWALRKGQLDDLETPAHRVLFEDQEQEFEHDYKEQP